MLSRSIPGVIAAGGRNFLQNYGIFDMLRAESPGNAGREVLDIHVLIAVDLQNDFVFGSLGTAEARAILPRAAERIRSFDGLVFFTQDTHGADYLSTQEGQRLPVPHCQKGSEGWQLCPEIEAVRNGAPAVEKPTFGSTELACRLTALTAREPIDSITLIGLCTDICVISNALLLKAAFPQVPIFVDAACCAGVTPESHRQALGAMAMCQITVENSEIPA